MYLAVAIKQRLIIPDVFKFVCGLIHLLDTVFGRLCKSANVVYLCLPCAMLSECTIYTGAI